MPVQIFSTIVGFFTGKHKMWFIGGIVCLVAGLFSWWALSTISGLKKENAQIALKIENKNLQDTIRVQEQERQDFQAKVNGIAATVEELNRKYSRNYIQRQTDVNSMTGKIERDNNGKINTQVLEQKANTGMNTLFDDLEKLSNPDETSKNSTH